MFTLYQTITIFAGYSDSHKLVLTVLKTEVPRSQPKAITYRDNKQFNSSKFKTELKNVLAKENIDSFIKSDEQFMKVLKSYAPLKRKSLRVNAAPYISKTLRSAIMKRPYLEKIYF